MNFQLDQNKVDTINDSEEWFCPNCGSDETKTIIGYERIIDCRDCGGKFEVIIK